MVIKNFPKEIKKFEIKTYERPKSLKGLRKTHAPFVGSPLKHPDDPKKIILVQNHYSSSPFYYEFKSDDVTYAEQLSSIVNLEGETVTMVRFWVKKMSVGILCPPFFSGRE